MTGGDAFFEEKDGTRLVANLSLWAVVNASGVEGVAVAEAAVPIGRLAGAAVCEDGNLTGIGGGICKK